MREVMMAKSEGVNKGLNKVAQWCEELQSLHCHRRIHT